MAENNAPVALEWESNARRIAAIAEAMIRSTGVVRLNAAASQLAAQVFRDSGEGNLPSQLWAGYGSGVIALSSNAVEGANAFKARWHGTRNPTLEVSLAGLLTRLGQLPPTGHTYRAPVQRMHHAHGPLVILRMDQMQNRPVRTVNRTSPR